MNIRTDRLHLKDYTSDDFNHYWYLKSSKEVWQYSTFKPFEIEQVAYDSFKELIHSLKDNPYQFAALWTKETNEFIGEAGILSFNPSANRCVIGYNLLPEYWKMGFGTEITKALVSYAFKKLDIERVEALALSSNIGSCKVLEKSGFSLEGTLRHFTRINGKYQDICYYSIISSDFF